MGVMVRLLVATHPTRYAIGLDAKKSDPNADTTALEKEISRLVYQLFGLTEEEIKIVEGEK